MHVIESFKPLGLLSILIFWVAITILITRWPRYAGKSISRHASSNRSAYWMMAVAETLTLTMLMLFLFLWMIPTLSLSFIFSISAILSSIGFIIAAWLPDSVGLKHTIHQIVAYSAAALFIPCTIALALSARISITARVFSAVSAIYMATMIAAFFLYPKAKNHHLIFQTIYIVCFHISILLAVYIR